MRTTTLALAAFIAGGLSLQAEEGGPDRRGNLFSRADADGDGSVTLAEFMEAQSGSVDKRFERLDEDGNELVTERELEVGRTRMLERRQRGGDRDKRGDRSGRGDRQAAPSFDELDTDGDGGLSLEEFLAMHKERLASRFDRMDENGDGVITEDEVGKRRGPPREGREKGRKRGPRGPDSDR